LKRWFSALLLVVAGCHDDNWLTYGWDDRRVLCSDSVDDIRAGLDRGIVEETFGYAERTSSVALFHAHIPGKTISRDAIASILRSADAHHLDYVGYDELRSGEPPRAGFAFAFDDQAVDAWMDTRDLFQAHGARVTFFVTRFGSYTDEMKASLAALAAEGHDIEAHSVSHVHAGEFVHDHGFPAYAGDEVLPSFQILKDAGYTPTAYAFPFGEADETLRDEVLSLDGVERIRVSPRACPY